MKILVLNAGSSSHKVCLFDVDSDAAQEPPTPIWRGQLDWSHKADQVELSAKTDSGTSVKDEIAVESSQVGLKRLLNTLCEGPTQVLKSLEEIDGVGHRVVHGGESYQASVQITPDVKQTIHDLFPLAPAHNPANLEGIEAMESLLAEVPQIAVFDTAFHAWMPEVASTYPGPYEWLEQGIRRYGFHGISHQYVAHQAARMLEQDLTDLKLITCHLGGGCSLAAVKHGYSIDTTMGFTPLEGLMMGSRSGSIDPGILLHLMRQGYDASRLNQLLNQESGLKGLSGISSDLRPIEEAIARNHPRAQLALDVFIHRLRQSIGAMIASLEGLDALVFTAGIGENSSRVWEQACRSFEFLGLRLDPAMHRSANDQIISASDSQIKVLAIHTQEEWAIAQDCIGLLQLHSS